MRYLLLLFVFITTSSLQAQELNCIVEIEYSKTQSTDPKVFETLKSSITEFMNNRKWTDDSYQPHERIDCSILINIDEELSANQFGGQFIIQSERPVYNSSYKTVVFSKKDDDFRFEYNEFDNLEFADNNFFSNLSSILGFYAYMVIAFDYESFAPEGGTNYLLKARDVVNSVPGNQRARFPGWSTFDNSRNRANLVEAVLNPRYKNFREILYKFHFEGLDKMYDDPDTARGVITEVLSEVKKLHKDDPTSDLLKIFFLAKSDELLNIYSIASNSEKSSIRELLKTMDPVNSNKYDEIR